MTPFLSHRETKSQVSKNSFIRMGNPTVNDRIQQSDHGFEVSDCINANVQCKTNEECQAICTKILEWRCEDGPVHACRPVTDDNIKPIRCVNGVLKLEIIDIGDSRDKVKYVCVCTNPFYYGPNCDKGSVGCDILKDKKCECNANVNAHFKHLLKDKTITDVCVPRKHYRLFASQPNFWPAATTGKGEKEEVDWFNYYDP